MENTYLNNKELLIDKGFAVIPVKGKRPYTDDWVNYDFNKDSSPIHNHSNIGIKTGKVSGVICVDIDTLDTNLQKQIYNLLPPLYSGKTGNKRKGNNYFFAYNGEVNESIRDVMDLLSDGKQTVLPPSIHPDFGYSYEWVGTPLTEIDKDSLPDLPANFMNNVRSICGGTSAAHGSSGRNESLKKIVTAMRDRDESERDIINEIFVWDRDNHNPPLFSDEKEGMRGDPLRNAWIFALNVSKSIAVKGLTDVPAFRKFEILEEEVTALDYKKNKLPKLRGIAQVMFKYIYDNAPIPRSQFAVASALSTMSTLLGNKIQYQGTLPNLYTMILGDSGSGKDFPLRFPTEVLNAIKLTHYIGEGMPSSDTSIIQNLAVQPVRVDVIDEASFLFNAGNSKESYLSNIANIYQSLYTSAGKYYAGKTAYKFKTKENELGRLGECQNPYVNIHCGMTIEDFRMNFSDKLMDKGLGGRFLYFIDDKPKRNQFRDVGHIPKEVIEYAERTTVEKGIYEDSVISSINVDTRTKSIILGAQKELDLLKLKATNECRIKPLLNRLPQLMIKLAMIDACSIGWEDHVSNVKLKADNIHWAMEWIEAHIKNTELFIDNNMSSGWNEKVLSIFMASIREAGGKISLTQFAKDTKIKKLGLLSNQRETFFKTLIEDGKIARISEGNATMLALIK